MRETEKVVELVFAELRRAEQLHPGWPKDVFMALAIVGEEFGAAQKAALDCVSGRNPDPEEFRKECIQLAAMSLRLLFNTY